MSTLVGLVVGAAAAAGLWLAMRDTFAAPVFTRVNHRGVTVPVGAGVILTLSLLVAAGIERGLAGLGVEQSVLFAGDAMVLAALGFGVLGLLDDLGGTSDEKGFRGHLGALASGRLTTGGLKLLGGGAIAVAVVAPFDGDRPVRLVVDAALVALAANLANLLDRAPGRVIKVTVIAGAIVLAKDLDGAPAGLAVIVGAAMGLAWFDLRERLMLGDAGANTLGAAVGLGVVAACSPTTRALVLVAVAALNLASERVSFSAVIERVRPLRALDRLGRPAA